MKINCPLKLAVAAAVCLLVSGCELPNSGTSKIGGVSANVMKREITQYLGISDFDVQQDAAVLGGDFVNFRFKGKEFTEKLFDYNITVISKSEPYRKNSGDVFGSTVGSYVDYTINLTVAFKKNLPFPISNRCEYVLFENLGGNYGGMIGKKRKLVGSSPGTFEVTKTVALAESTHLFGVFEGSASQEDGAVRLDFVLNGLWIN